MENFIPTNCHECGEKLKVITGKNGKYKLICDNDECNGVEILKFQRGMSSFEISGIGPAIYKKLYVAGVRDISDLLTITKEDLINSGEFKDGKSLDNLINSIKSIKSLRVSSIIESLQLDGIGKTISKEVEKYFFELDYDFTGIDYSIREQIIDENSDIYEKLYKIIDKISTLPNVNIIKPDKNKKESNTPNVETKIFEMTGSPKSFGFNTKNDFIKAVEPFGLVHGKLNKDCDYLVTDDTESKTSKMDKAEKLGVKIVTYIELFNMFND